MEKRTIAIPEDVVDPKAYLKWYALQNHPTLRNVIYTSSQGDEINITMFPDKLRKHIEHLSPTEQEHIFELKHEHNQMRCKANAAKAKAYGRAGRLGGRDKNTKELWKITPFEEDIIELLGRMFTIPEVVRIMGEDNGIIINEEDVTNVLKKHIVEIEKKRDEFRQKVTDVRLYNKRPRLEELAWMYSKMKNRYITFNQIDAYNAMLRTLEQIRKEAEGDIVNINGALDVNIEVTIQEHIQAQILKTINLKEIVLGRIAARMNYDPQKLIAGLHNSYYAKFMEISGDLDKSQEMVYPSSMHYDFTKIEREAESNTMDVQAEDVTPEQHSSAQNIKKLFLDKLRQQKENLAAKQNFWDQRGNLNRDEVEDVEKAVNRNSRGRFHDEDLPSKSKVKGYKNRNKNYYTGEYKK